jgi:hypothetical protein
MSNQNITAKTEGEAPSFDDVSKCLREMDEQDAMSFLGEPPTKAERWLYARGLKGFTVADWKQWKSEEADYRSQPPVDYTTVSKHDKQEALEQWALEERASEYFPVIQVEYDSLLERARGTAGTRTARKKAAADAEARKKAAAADAAARLRAEQARIAQLMIELKAYQPELQELDLKPINLADLSKVRMNPTKAKQDLLKRWAARFEQLPWCVRTAWCAYYNERGFDHVDTKEADDTDTDPENTGIESGTYQTIYLKPIPHGELEMYAPDEILKGIYDPAWDDFLKFSKGVRRAYLAIGNDGLDNLIDPQGDPDPEMGARTIDEIPDKVKPDLVPGVIPHGVTFVVGAKDAGKSAMTHKLGQAVASDSTDFEGIAIEHGPVLLATLDNGASAVDTKPRLITIRKRMRLPSSGRFTVTDDMLYLNEPSSVEHWMETHRCPSGPYKLLTIDPLNEAVSPGSSLQAEGTISSLKAALKKLLREGFAESIVIVTHPPKAGGDDPFGSYLQGTTANGIVKIERTGDNVTARVIRNKNGRPRAEPFEWWLDPADGFLVPRNERPRKPGRPAKKTTAADAEALHSAILSVLPMGPIRSDAALKLIDDLIPGAQAVRKVQWQRIRKAMADAGLIAVRESDGERRQPPMIERLR